MSSKHIFASRPVTVAISIIIVITIIYLVGSIMFSLVFNKQTTKTQRGSVENQNESQIINPHTVTATEAEGMSGIEFANKYKDQWIQFDGIIFATSKPDKNAPLSTTLIVGDDPNQSLLDLSTLKIYADKATFDTSLQEYSVINNSPYETGKYPKVKVIAKVVSYDSNILAVYLEPRQNKDGASPSIIIR